MDAKKRYVSNALPEDVVEEILSRLPVKSLLRFRSVSKMWNALIKSSYFSAIHLHRSELNTCLLINWTRTTWYCPHNVLISLLRDETSFLRLDLPFLNGRDFFVVGSSKGLVCLRQFRNYNYGEYSDESIIVWNPATMQTRRLPNPAFLVKSYTICFEFIHEISDYKLVAVYWNPNQLLKDEVVVRAKVYTRNTDSWREVESYSSSTGFYCLGVIDCWPTIREVVYMQDLRRTRGTRSLDGMKLLSFDLRNEVFNAISIPAADVSFVKIFSWKNSLALLGLRESSYEIWVMNHEDQYSSAATRMPWTKLFTYESPFLGRSGAWKDDFILVRNDGVDRW